MKRFLGILALAVLLVQTSVGQNLFGRKSAGPPGGCPDGPTTILDTSSGVLWVCVAPGAIPVPAGDPWVSSISATSAQTSGSGTTDQVLLSSTIGQAAAGGGGLPGMGAGLFPMNLANRGLTYVASGTYAVGTASTVTFKTKLCTVSNCGSGTVTTLATWGPTASQTNTGVTLGWNIDAECETVTIGSSGSLVCHGSLNFDSGASLTAAATSFNDTNTAAVGSLPLNGQWFLVTTISFQSGNASNTATQQIQLVQLNGPGVVN